VGQGEEEGVNGKRRGSQVDEVKLGSQDNSGRVAYSLPRIAEDLGKKREKGSC
jgi:hypothetical protein